MVVFKICNKCSPLEKSHPFSYGICCRWLPHHLEEGAGSVNDFRSPGGWVNVSPLHAIIEALEPSGAYKSPRSFLRYTPSSTSDTGPANKCSTAPWVSLLRTFLRWTFSSIRGRWHLCCCNIVQPLAINPIPNRLLYTFYTKKSVGFGNPYIFHVNEVKAVFF